MGSSSASAPSALAAAAAVSSAAARRLGLSCWLLASSPSSVAPSDLSPSCARAGETAPDVMTITSPAARSVKPRMSLSELDGKRGAHRVAFALHFGGHLQRPITGHAGLD